MNVVRKWTFYLSEHLSSASDYRMHIPNVLCTYLLINLPILLISCYKPEWMLYRESLVWKWAFVRWWYRCWCVLDWMLYICRPQNGYCTFIEECCVSQSESCTYRREYCTFSEWLLYISEWWSRFTASRTFQSNYNYRSSLTRVVRTV